MRYDLLVPAEVEAASALVYNWMKANRCVFLNGLSVDQAPVRTSPRIRDTMELELDDEQLKRAPLTVPFGPSIP